MTGFERGRQLDRVGLPPRPFLYTLDQVADLISITQRNLELTHCHFEGRTTAVYRPAKLMCRNIAEPEDKPDWRITEKELLRWLRNRGYRYYTRGYVE